MGSVMGAPIIIYGNISINRPINANLNYLLQHIFNVYIIPQGGMCFVGVWSIIALLVPCLTFELFSYIANANNFSKYNPIDKQSANKQVFISNHALQCYYSVFYSKGDIT